jgi:hypothetical protein
MLRNSILTIDNQKNEVGGFLTFTTCVSKVKEIVHHLFRKSEIAKQIQKYIYDDTKVIQQQLSEYRA